MNGPRTTLRPKVFKPQFGKVLNSNHVVDGCNKLTEWYESRKMPIEYYGIDVSDGILEMSIEEPRIGEVRGGEGEGATPPCKPHLKSNA